MTGDQVFAIVVAIFLFILFIVLVANASYFSKFTKNPSNGITSSNATALVWVNGILAFITAILFFVALFRSFKSGAQREALYKEYLGVGNL
ncbi:MAG: hypothetical protein Solumvirus3_12 [Solumvirus sp.]|uniref:Uncharacterized protein n=1 Tax=Solumvirus sp. TaxID=2487773 RepID=A0A3G5AGC6_9VIRU|nr:MAG: hypothetical protein Solumvirus3_12 [Solumvirus sp.]